MFAIHMRRQALTLFSFTRIVFLAILFALPVAPGLFAADPDIFPLSQVKPGMKGEALTIFAGDQIEKFDLVVIGVMPVAYAASGMRAIPLAFVIVAVVMAIFLFAYLSMARHVREPGGFFAYISIGLNRPLGVAGAMVADRKSVV